LRYISAVTRAVVLVVVGVAACSSKSAPSQTAYFDLDSDLTAGSGAFYSMPFPSDVRVDQNGAPDVAGYPNPRDAGIITSLLSIVPEHKGFPVMSTAYFRFTDAVPARALTDVITDGSVVLVDIDPSSDELGATYPVIADTLDVDTYVPTNLVAIAPRPGIVLRPSTQYAYVVRTAFAPEFEPAPAFAELAAGKTPSGTRGSATAATFANLWPALQTAGIPTSDVIVATTFTTADQVARTSARSEAIRAAYKVTLDNLTLMGSDTYDGFCALTGTITMPQFQTGTPPFNTDGTFVLDANDVPQMQTTMTIPMTITLPKLAMPANGFPLYQFFHGSGGSSTDIVNLGPSPTSADIPTPGYGPGYVVALHGIAGASAALPLNPERFPGASDYEYLNIDNLAAFPYTFQQGVFEQRLFTDALSAVHIPAAALAGCSGISTSSADDTYFFDTTKLVAGGQSMGGMYTNMIGAVEPRFGAFVPTGAGGFWNLMILETVIVPGIRPLLTAEFNVADQDLSFVHPTLNALALSWEPAEPIVSMNRISERPLPGTNPRDVYEPVGQYDSYFPMDVYDAAATSYHHNEAGTEIWTTMQDALALEHLDGVLGYPITANRNGHTRVVVQYMGDGIIDPHYIYRQLPAVKHQYGCFLETYLKNGVATVYAPGDITDACQ
jgi:hypothetical protein